MKKRKFVSTIALATIGIASLSACQPLDKAGEKQEVKQEKVKALSEAEYEVAVSEKSKEFYELLKKVLTELSETTVIDSEFLDKLHKDTETMEKLTKEVVALEPPSSYKKVDEAYEKAMKEFQIFLKGFEKALDEKDISLVNDVYENSIKAEQLLNHANALLSVTYAQPVGDGTITTDDLKDLDANAGIDRDSVLLNVSEDGKELAGKWGYFNDDGTFNVSLVLESDGSYSGFAKGTYPETDMTGTWKYDYLQHTLVFDHEKADYRSMTMDLQAFYEDTVQLLDVESWNTFRYSREGSPNPKESNDKPTTNSPAQTTTTPEKAPTTSTSSSGTVTKSELTGTSWNLDSDTWEYRGLFLNDDGSATYSWSLDDIDEVYRGTWDLKGNTIIFDVEKAEENYGDEMKNPPKTLSFEIVSHDDKAMKLKFKGEVANYKLYE